MSIRFKFHSPWDMGFKEKDGLSLTSGIRAMLSLSSKSWANCQAYRVSCCFGPGCLLKYPTTPSFGPSMLSIRFMFPSSWYLSFKEKYGLCLTSGIRARLGLSSKSWASCQACRVSSCCGPGSVLKCPTSPSSPSMLSVRLMFSSPWHLGFKEKDGLGLTSGIRARLGMSSKVGPVVKHAKCPTAVV